MRPETLALKPRRSPDRHDRQRDDAGGEGQPLSAVGELAGHEVVAGEEGGETREVSEARVGCQHEDQGGGDLRDDQHDPVAGQVTHEQAQDGLLLDGIGDDPQRRHEIRDTDE
jgi:hypothetical protein